MTVIRKGTKMSATNYLQWQAALKCNNGISARAMDIKQNVNQSLKEKHIIKMN